MTRASLAATALLFIATLAGAQDFKPTYWTLNPVAQEGLDGAKMALVGGHTFPGEFGAHFQLKQLTTEQPVDLQLVSKSGKQLEIIAFKTTAAEPLLEARTDGDGVARLGFRANGPIYFRVTGPFNEAYELALVVGEPLVVPPVDSIVKMSEHGVTTEAAPAQIAAIAEAANSFVRDDAEEASSSAITIMLALILVALVGIAVILLRKNRLVTGAAAVTLAMLMLGSSAEAQMNEFSKRMLEDRTLGGSKEYRDRIKPGLIAPPFSTKESQGFINDTKKKWDNINKTRGQFKSIIDWAFKANDFLKKRGLIDPKDAAIQPNYNPRGMPKLASSYLDELNPNTEKMIAYEAIAERIVRARIHLEKNYVARKETEYEVGIIREMAEAAASMSAFAKIAWEKAKSEKNKGFNASAAKFYAKYDEGQANGIDYLEKALRDMAEFEAKYYKKQNWYVYYGLPFLQFMRLRYIRPDM